MQDLLKRYFCGRRNIHFILTCVLLALLFLVVILYFIPHEVNTVENEAVDSKEPRIGISFVDNHPDHYYIAAVIDYEVLFLPDVVYALRINLKYITDAIAECRRFNVDIVVFPEDSLIACLVPILRTSAFLISTSVPSATDFIVPCYNKEYQQSFLREISCAAKQNGMYVAVNVMERVLSPRSTYWDGLLYHKTEVVFDRNGMVIARYRKYNLFTERWTHHTSTTDEPEYVTFDTDFGVKFGILICFDIFFTEPAVELARKHNISHFVFPSVMITKLPFLSASTSVSGWSHALDVVMLSSSSPINPKYTLGTNINFGRRLGTRTYVLPFGSSNIIISPVPKSRHFITPEYPEFYNSLETYTPGKNRQTSFFIEHVLDRMTTQALTSSNDQNEATFSYKSETFECNISLSWEIFGFGPSNYQFIAYSGLSNFSVANINYYAEMCGITLCSRYSSSSCQQPPIFDDASKSTFTSVNISTRSTSLDELRIPAAFDSNLVALDGSYFDFKSRQKSYFGRTMNTVEMFLKRPAVNMMTFAVYKCDTRAKPMINYNVFDHMMNLDRLT